MATGEAADRQAVEVGQAEVEQEQVGGTAQQVREGVAPARHPIDDVAALSHQDTGDRAATAGSSST